MSKISKLIQRPFAFLRRHPLISFLISLALLMGTIFLANYLRQVQPTAEVASTYRKAVTIYQADQAYLVTKAKVDNQGIINVVVQNPSGGVVQRINVTVGQKVYRGQTLASLANNYQGGNTSALALEIAEKNWLMTHANFWDQENVDSMSSEISTNSNWVAKQLTPDAYAKYAAGLNQEMQNIASDMTQRGQQLALDSAESQFFSAQIAASLMTPASPVAGVVEKVHVAQGQVTAAGSAVATIKATDKPVRLLLSVGANVITHLNPLAPAYLQYQDQSIPLELEYLPTTPTAGSSYDLTYTLDQELAQTLPHGTFFTINLPLIPTSAQDFLVPLTAVYQTQEANYLYVLVNDDQGNPIARQKQVELGSVVGELVSIHSGLETTDNIILDNQLYDGQAISLTPNQ